MRETQVRSTNNPRGNPSPATDSLLGAPFCQRPRATMALARDPS